MPRVLVIADDLTGAAEISGIATRFGLDTQLLRTPVPPPTACDCVVYDTDTRLKPLADAVRITRYFAEAARVGSFDWVFKKTDSVLRGEPVAEVTAVADVFRRRHVLFLPHNPSRGRCITGGVYSVHGTPLHQTEFSDDPLHPAKSDDVIALLRSTGPGKIAMLAPGDRPGDGITVCAAADAKDVAGWAERFDGMATLAAGGADFFEALCRCTGSDRVRTAAHPVLPRPLLIVSGTASHATSAFRERMRSDGLLVRMPNDLFDGTADTGGLLRWTNDVRRALRNAGMAMMAIDRPTDAVPGRPEFLGQTLVNAACRVMQIGQLHTVACEGGATAAAWCDAVGWQRFQVDAELASGVVSLRPYPDGTVQRLVVKPGSYAWPTL